MKKNWMFFAFLSATILGLLGSCIIPSECYDYRERMHPTPYSDTDYNSVSAIAYKYLSHPLGQVDVDTNNHPLIVICSEDSTVMDQEIKVYGVLYRNRWSRGRVLRDTAAFRRDEPVFLTNTIDVSYDTSDHAIMEKLKGLDSCKIYIKGHLRMYTARCSEDERFLYCSYIIPGIFIYSADDITLTPKRNEDN